MLIYSLAWLEVLSDLFVNLAALWFGIVIVEPGLTTAKSLDDVLPLSVKFSYGIFSLLLAKYFREKVQK